MNKKAEELGLKNTHFVTPHGLDETEHYTTAYELALVTDYALTLKKFSTIVNTKSVTIHINGQEKAISNTNELLGNLYGVDGVKTGFTNNAGRCLVTSTTRNGHQIISVVLGADTKKIRTADSVRLIEYAFSNYEYVPIQEKIQRQFNDWRNENLNNMKIIKGKIEVPEIALEELEYKEIPIYKNDVKDLEIQIECVTELQAPVQENQVIGTLEVKLKDEILIKKNIYIQNQIEKKNILQFMGQLLIHYNMYLQTGLKQEILI